MLETLGGAFTGAFISTLPVGPLNVALLQLAFAARYRHWFAMAAGIVVADVGVALSTYCFSDWLSLTLSESMRHASYILAAAFCFAFGALSLKERLDDEASRVIGRSTSYFVVGFAWTACQPALYGFWAAWWLTLTSVETTRWPQVLAGVVSGDAVVFLAYLVIATQGKVLVSARYLARLRRGMAYSLWILGCFYLLRWTTTS